MATPNIKSVLLLVTCFLFREASGQLLQSKKMPNLLFILMDDMGWNDLGAHDPSMVTPTLDRLYNEGFRMNYSYTDPAGSSSRASLFSGVFSFKMGLQDGAIHKYSSAHVPVRRKLLPLALDQIGYYTHLVGKWNQGFCNEKQTPTKRGFQSFFGQYTESTNHMTMKTEEGFTDLHDNNEEVTDPRFLGLYSTDLWGKRAVRVIRRHRIRFPHNNVHPFFLMLSMTAIRAPNDVPDKYIRRCRKSVFPNEERRRKCAMMGAVDVAVARILRALWETEQDQHTIIIFTSDNGGASDLGSSDWPLRGSKGTVWEGGIRVPTFIWSANQQLLPVMNYTYPGPFHMVDWYPTLLGFALKSTKPKMPIRYAPAMDGRNHWRFITRGLRKSFRTRFAYLVNETDKQVAYVREGDFKLVVNELNFPGWYAPPVGASTTGLEKPTQKYKHRPFLMFNVRRDPSETRDLSRVKAPRVVSFRTKLLALWDYYRSHYVSKRVPAVDSSPAHHPEYNNTWSAGSC